MCIAMLFVSQAARCCDVINFEIILIFLKVGIHLYSFTYNLNCKKYVTNCSNVYPPIQLLKMSG